MGEGGQNVPIAMDAWSGSLTLSEELNEKKTELNNAQENICIQLITINMESSVNTAMEEWPYLFETANLLDHTNTLLGISLQTKLAEEISRKAKSIKDSLKQKCQGQSLQRPSETNIQHHIPPKQLKFLSELNDFENPWKS